MKAIILLVFVLAFCFKSKAQLSTKFVSVTDLGGNNYKLTGGTLSSGTYTWRMTYSPSGGSWINLAGPKSNTVTVSAFTKAYFVLTDSISPTVYSCVVSVPPSPCDTPTVSISKATICPTDTIVLYSSIVWDCYQYQWQDSLSGDIPGAVESSFKVAPPILDAKKYRIKFTCPSGTTYSKWFEVNPISSCDTAEITLSRSTACTGDTLNLAATGISPCSSIQWEDSLTGSIAGAVSSILILPAPAAKTAYRLKSICPLGKTAYSKWESFTPYTCDTPALSISSTKGCAGDTIKLQATGLSPCIALQWEDSLTGPISGANDSILIVSAGVSRNAYRLKTTCASGSIIYSDWMSFTPFASCADSVWPGDINWDLTADYLDVLELGVAYGFSGPTRPGASIGWAAEYAPNWPYFFSSTVNYKHADCNGDGNIDLTDLSAIALNYGKIHMAGVTVPEYPAKVAEWPDLYFDLSGLHPAPGDFITVPLKFGDVLKPITNAYGIAAKLYVNTEPLITPASIDCSLSWLSKPISSAVFTYSSGNNILDWTFVRTDHNNNTGYGTLGLLTFQVPSTATDNNLIGLNFLSIKVIDSSGKELTGYNVLQDTITIHTSGLEEYSLQSHYYLYPNPGNGNFMITQAAGQPATSVATIFDVSGRKVMQTNITFVNGRTKLNVDAGPGIYLLRLENEDRMLHQQRLIIR